MDDHTLAGKNLLVIGDVQLKLLKGANGERFPGVASDEVVRHGWNKHKIERLTRAGADLLVADFIHFSELIRLFVSSL